MPSPPRRNLRNVLPFVLESMNIANLERLRQVSPEYRNIINRSGVLRRKIQEARRTIRERTAARLQTPVFRYINAPRWKQIMFPELRIGLHPTVGAGGMFQYAWGMGPYIRKYAGRTPRGTLPATHKRTYNAWAQEYGRPPYTPNNINKQHVARALLRGFRKKRFQNPNARPNRNNFPNGPNGSKAYRNALNNWTRRGAPGGSTN